ncbi:2OG-Fe dioxygenase family protein, partial [Agrobacterium cavarae]|uniref:2OG-Fe dioxygenase family protein n=1 Tax=Agrobacterium cavarae TaxID=2528239 RepID=UPI0028AE7589
MLERLSKKTKAEYIGECVENLQSNGWWFSRSEITIDGFDIDPDGEWNDFADHWDHLLRDEYMRDGGTYRYRRYSAFELDAKEGRATLLPHAPYEQSASINTLNGGFKRHFEPLEDSFIEHPVFKKIITNFGRIFSETTGHYRWNVKLHPYRIVALDGASGEPAPEGLHQDGVDFIVSYMIRRVNV